MDMDGDLAPCRVHKHCDAKKIKCWTLGAQNAQ